MMTLSAVARWLLVTALLLSPVFLGACAGATPSGTPDPCAWLEIGFESSDPVQLLALADRIEVVIDPTTPLVDESGVPFPEGPIVGTGISFSDAVTSDQDLEMVVTVALEGDALPTVALELGANVPIGLSIDARALDAAGVVVAESSQLGLIEISACDVFSVTLTGLDPEVEPPGPSCSDGLDNDGDGWIDLQDPGCEDDPETSEDDGFGTNECNDGIDNDGDGLIDSQDQDCGSAAGDDEGQPSVPPCSDGVDNDDDGWVDLDDPGCEDDPLGGNEFSFSSLACSDGTDNDGDGLADAEDPDCEDGYDDSEELVLAACEDGLDNDGDSWVDGDDPGCDSPTDENEGNAGTTECNDGLDNDGDGYLDSADPECATALTDSEAALGDDDDSAFGDDDDDDSAFGDDDDSAFGDDDDSAFGDDDDSAASALPYTFTEVFAVISGGCACHSQTVHPTGFAFAGDAATLYGMIVNTPAFETSLTSGLDRIEPGLSADSYLMHKLDGTQVNGLLSDGVSTVQGMGAQMPLAGAPLALEVRDRLRAWIDSGAPNN
jgi:hypothetical protein